MSDLVVREACKHGQYDKHVVWQSEAYAHPCPGGREILLRAVEADGISSGGEWLPAIVYVLEEA